MSGQLWSWVLSAIGITGFFLAGKKVWWCWYVNLANQALCLVYSLITGQYGFLIATSFYTFVFANNAISWTKEHRDHKPVAFDLNKPVGKVISVTEVPSGIMFEGSFDLDFNEYRFLREQQSMLTAEDLSVPNSLFEEPLEGYPITLSYDSRTSTPMNFVEAPEDEDDCGGCRYPKSSCPKEGCLRLDPSGQENT